MAAPLEHAPVDRMLAFLAQERVAMSRVNAEEIEATIKVIDVADPKSLLSNLLHMCTQRGGPTATTLARRWTISSRLAVESPMTPSREAWAPDLTPLRGCQTRITIG
jgi:hypothetical protein